MKDGFGNKASKNPCNQILILEESYPYISQKNTISIFRLLLTKIKASSNKKKCKIDERWLRK